MKKYLAGFLMALATLFAAPAWSHHAAEGIVSDEIWDMIDGLLEDADSPHLDMVLDLDNMGRPTLFTTVGLQDLDDMEDLMDDISAEVADWEHRERGVSAVTVSDPVFNDETGYWEITISEPIGRGRSQTNPIDEPEDAPGQQGPRP